METGKFLVRSLLEAKRSLSDKKDNQVVEKCDDLGHVENLEPRAPLNTDGEENHPQDQYDNLHSKEENSLSSFQNTSI